MAALAAEGCLGPHERQRRLRWPERLRITQSSLATQAHPGPLHSTVLRATATWPFGKSPWLGVHYWISRGSQWIGLLQVHRDLCPHNCRAGAYSGAAAAAGGAGQCRCRCWRVLAAARPGAASHRTQALYSSRYSVPGCQTGSDRSAGFALVFTTPASSHCTRVRWCGMPDQLMSALQVAQALHRSTCSTMQICRAAPGQCRGGSCFCGRHTACSPERVLRRVAAVPRERAPRGGGHGRAGGAGARRAGRGAGARAAAVGAGPAARCHRAPAGGKHTAKTSCASASKPAERASHSLHQPASTLPARL